MRDVQAQVLGVTTEQTRNNKTKYNVQLSNGETVTAWDLELATKAQGASTNQGTGEVVTARIEDKPGNNPGVVYKNLKELFTAGQATAIPQAAGSPVSLAAPIGAPIPPIQSAPPSQGRSGGYSGGMSAEDKVRVTKLSCISSAAATFSGSGDIEAVLEAAKVIFRSLSPEQVVAVAAVAAPLLEAGAPIQVGTEGITPAAEPATLPWS